MAYNYEYPGVNMNDYNNDWILKEMKDTIELNKNFSEKLNSIEIRVEDIEKWIKNPDISEVVDDVLHNMLENGELNALLTHSITFFDSTTDMISTAVPVENALYATFGYHSNMNTLLLYKCEPSNNNLPNVTVNGFTMKYIGNICPESFGAYGTGVQDDSSSLQLFFNYVFEHEIAHSFLRNKYLISNITINKEPENRTKNHIHNGTFINNSDDVMFSGSATAIGDIYFSDTEFIGLTFTNPGNIETPVGTCFDLSKLIRSTFRNCTFRGFNSVFSGYAQNIIIDHCRFFSIYGVAVNVSSVYKLTIKDCICELSEHAKGFLNCDRASGCLVENCTIEGLSECDYTIKITNSSNVKISSCYFELNASYIYVSGNLNDCITVEDCLMFQTTDKALVTCDTTGLPFKLYLENNNAVGGIVLDNKTSRPVQVLNNSTTNSEKYIGNVYDVYNTSTNNIDNTFSGYKRYNVDGSYTDSVSLMKYTLPGYIEARLYIQLFGVEEAISVKIEISNGTLKFSDDRASNYFSMSGNTLSFTPPTGGVSRIRGVFEYSGQGILVIV